MSDEDPLFEAVVQSDQHWIGKMMKEFHAVEEGYTFKPIEELNEAEIISYEERKNKRLSLNPTPPSGGSAWLANMPCGTTFLTTKKSMLSQPELIKAILISKTDRSALLLLDIPGTNAKMDLYVNIIMYQQMYELMDIL